MRDDGGRDAQVLIHLGERLVARGKGKWMGCCEFYLYDHLQPLAPCLLPLARTLEVQ